MRTKGGREEQRRLEENSRREKRTEKIRGEHKDGERKQRRLDENRRRERGNRED
jgi:hypothetical protein